LPSSIPASCANRLLAAMRSNDRQRFLARSESVELEFGEILAEPGRRIKHVYFPVTGFISLLAPTDPEGRIEVGLIGDEGMFGSSVILGVNASPLRAMVQGAGTAERIGTAPFNDELQHSAILQRNLKRYLYVQICQLAQTSTCTRFHVVEARLARWLLMTQDRAHSDSFHVTQEFLAYMLGVRRVGVTKAASSLQGQNLISYRRGDITILDRQGLEARSCPCYATDKASYSEIMG